MKIIKDIGLIQKEISGLKKGGAKTGLVPTMGFLHKGHTSLIERSVRECDITTVSIFVNPIQFGQDEDFDSYPRDMQRDCDIIKQAGADFIFIPEPKDMYKNDFKTYISVKKVSNVMCGKHRPGHFDGVCTVVLKLLNIIKPDIAYFGLKDFQQLLIIKKMAEDLNVGITIQECPLVREKDGLAMSSRNTYLSDKERENAAILYQVLKTAASMIKRKDISLEKIKKESLHALYNNSYVQKVDYFDFRNPETLEEIKSLKNYFKSAKKTKILIASAIRIGSTRLIDNVVI